MKTRPRVAGTLAIATALRAVALCMFLMVNKTAIAIQPDYGKAANEGLATGIKIGVDTLKEAIKIEPTRKGIIETKDGNLKIDTQDEKTVKQASKFRKNYKKTAECLEPANEIIRIKCANKYIQARKKAINQNQSSEHANKK